MITAKKYDSTSGTTVTHYIECSYWERMSAGDKATYQVSLNTCAQQYARNQLYPYAVMPLEPVIGDQNVLFAPFKRVIMQFTFSQTTAVTGGNEIEVLWSDGTNRVIGEPLTTVRVEIEGQGTLVPPQYSIVYGTNNTADKIFFPSDVNIPGFQRINIFHEKQ